MLVPGTYGNSITLTGDAVLIREVSANESNLLVGQISRVKAARVASSYTESTDYALAHGIGELEGSQTRNCWVPTWRIREYGVIQIVQVKSDLGTTRDGTYPMWFY